MAKFLPFIVAKSTPLSIYSTLISRSKGISNFLVTSIFYLLVDKGISEVRKAAAELPDMPAGKVYEALLSKYPEHRISNSMFQKIQQVSFFIKDEEYESITDQLYEFELLDIMSFLLIMYLTDNLKDYTTLKLENLFNGNEENAENSLIASKLFSNDGKIVQFASREELAGYIHFYSLISSKKYEPVRAIYYPQPDKKQESDTKYK